MQETGTVSLRSFAIAVIILEVFFALIYGFNMGFNSNLGIFDFSGLIISIFLAMLMLIGFGLLSTYLKGSALTNMMFTFITLAFTIQFYFLVRNFWMLINVSDNINSYPKLGSFFNYIGLTNGTNRTAGLMVTDATLPDALACAISMFIALTPLFGRIGPFEVLVVSFIGNFAYALNEAIFWRLFIEDNGYAMRIFLFGSLMGIVTGLIMGKKEETKGHPAHNSEYYYEFTGLVGSIFVMIFLPWLSVVNQLPSGTILTFTQIAPLNTWYAISGSVCSAFCMSILLNEGKLSIYEIIFASFTGAIAYGSSSNVFPFPFPAILVGILSGAMCVALLHYA